MALVPRESQFKVQSSITDRNSETCAETESGIRNPEFTCAVLEKERSVEAETPKLRNSISLPGYGIHFRVREKDRFRVPDVTAKVQVPRS